MAGIRSSILIFFRENPRSRRKSSSQIRNLSNGGKVGDSNQVEVDLLRDREVADKENLGCIDIVKQVCHITRTRPRWEQTLLSDFPSFDFADPRFFRELLKQQGNVLLSLRFFYWLRSRFRFSPDPDSCNVLFNALVEAKAPKVAKGFLKQIDFHPEPVYLERYLICLCEGGLFEDATEMVSMLKGTGYCPSIAACKSVLLCCLKARKTDLLWGFYRDMIDSGVIVDIDVEIIEILILALCCDGKVSDGYELLQDVLKDGVVPGNICFNKLIAGFCSKRKYGRVSGLLHSMIERNTDPDIYTYQEVINGLCKTGMILEGYRVFDDLKDRGYAPDTVMYTTMINGLCRIGYLGDARKLWFEMIRKGLSPNEYTYHSLLTGFCKVGDLEGAVKLRKEICDRGYRETTLGCNKAIARLCSHSRIDQAYYLFKKMPQKGIERDLITFNTLIKGFCKKGKIVEGTNLLRKLLAEGLQPSASSYTPIIEKLLQSGCAKEAKDLSNDMQSRGLKPKLCTYDHIITGLCKEGYIEDSMEHLVGMLKSKLRPKRSTFETLVECLLQFDRVDASLIALEYMFSVGYSLKKGMCRHLVTKFCGGNSDFIKAYCMERRLRLIVDGVSI